MQKALILLFMLIALKTNCQTNTGMPDLKDVIKAFFSLYTWAEPSESYLRFEKKASGWYAGEVSYQAQSLIKPSVLFWNKASATYERLPFEVRTNMDSTAINSEINSYNERFADEVALYNYSRNLYFGYEGWDWDVITGLQHKASLSDTLLESLGRAYSNYAINFFYDQWGLSISNDDSDRVKLKDSDPVSISRVKKYIGYEQSSIQTYQRLAALNPHYMTRVGDVASKKSNEQMFAYTTLQIIGYNDEAAGFLSGIEFPDSIMQNVKNMLAEVKPNSIFITQGDNITYPVWLLQARGIRKDVIAIDYSLLGLRRVLIYLDKIYHRTLLNTDSSIYMNPLFDYALYQQEYSSDKEITLAEFLSKLYSSPELKSAVKNKKTIYYTDDKSFKYFNRNVSIPVDLTMAKKLYGPKQFYKKLYVPMERAYFLMGDIIILGIIKKHFTKKHIYFAFDIAGATKSNTGVVQRKYVWELTPEIQ